MRIDPPTCQSVTSFSTVRVVAPLGASASSFTHVLFNGAPLTSQRDPPIAQRPVSPWIKPMLSGGVAPCMRYPGGRTNTTSAFASLGIGLASVPMSKNPPAITMMLSDVLRRVLTVRENCNVPLISTPANTASDCASYTTVCPAEIATLSPVVGTLPVLQVEISDQFPLLTEEMEAAFAICVCDNSIALIAATHTILANNTTFFTDRENKLEEIM